MRVITTLGSLSLVGSATAHFVLQIPASLGFDDTKETESPCGSFDPSDRSKGVTEWPVGGHPIGLISTHSDVQWDISAALLSSPTNFQPLVLSFKQKGVGDVCFEAIPGNPDWVGQDAVLQIVQHAVDGLLYQCAAIKFVAGGPAPVPGDCTNFPGVSHDPIVPAPRPSTSSTPPPPSSTTVATSTTAAPTTTGGSSTPTNTSPSGSSSMPTGSTTGGHSHGEPTTTKPGNSTSPTSTPTHVTVNGAAQLLGSQVGALFVAAAFALLIAV